MFLNMPNDLRLVPSLLDKVVMWSLDIMQSFLDDLLFNIHTDTICSSFMLVTHWPG